MKIKNIARIFLLYWLIFISACQEALFHPAELPITTATKQSNIIATLPTKPAETPESLAFVDSMIVSKGLPPKQGNAMVSFPTQPGDYLVYWTQRGLMQYVSLDGTIRGNLVEDFIINELELTLETNGLDPIGMATSREGPYFIFMQDRNDKYGTFNSASVWITDIFGAPIQSWKISSGSEFHCLKPLFSPKYQWVLIDCSIGHEDGGLFYEIDHQLRLINTKTGRINVISVTECRDGEYFFSQQVIWSEDETNFSYRCGYDEYALVSTKDNSLFYKTILITHGRDTKGVDILSISPDWKKVVFDMDDMPKDVDGTVSVNRIHVADLDCVLNDSVCSEITTFDLPLSQPVDLTNNDYVKTQIYWISPWNSMAWLNTTMKTSSYGCIDILTSVNQDCRRNLSGQEYLSVSPDGQWLIFIGYIVQKDQPLVSRYLYAVSVKDNTIRYLAESDVNNAVDYIRFYGWLTIQ